MMLKKARPTRRIQMIKMMHNWQNTGKQKAIIRDARLRADTPLPLAPTVEETTCHLCPHGCGRDEGYMHYLTCTTETAKEERKRLIKKVLRRLRSLRTSASIMSTVGYVLASLSETEEVDLEQDNRNCQMPPMVKEAMECQSVIGWIEFCQGFYHKVWTKIQEIHYKREGKNTKYLNMGRWKRMFGTILCDYSLDCWDLRNRKLHGDSSPEARVMILKRLRDQVKELYKEKKTVRGTENGKIFDMPLGKRQKMGIHSTKIWISMAEEVLRLHCEKTTKLTLHQWLINR
jgi:hypothetical protein